MDARTSRYYEVYACWQRDPQAFWGDGPDLIGTVFGMFNHVHAPLAAGFSLNKLKFGTEWTYVPLSWLGLGARYDVVEPNLDLALESFSVISPRIIFRTAFVTHEQVMIQYSRYFYGSEVVIKSGVPAVDDPTLSPDKNVVSLSATMWW